MEKPLGKIITFYSYKGGTGRSMALANIAWILASNGKKVLTVDWDLEAPGLHRYFAPFLVDKELSATDGLMDLVDDFRLATITPDPTKEANWHLAYADAPSFAVSLEWDFNGGRLDLLPAGRQCQSYSALVNSFSWQDFYERHSGGAFLDAMKQRMKEEYDYVLIDSRTGVSDTSGICTVQMPDALVVCFTLNNQSIEGASAVAHSANEQRLRQGLELAVFPVPMRVEPFEKSKLDVRREYAKRMFELFPAHLPPPARAQFQEDVQVKYLPYYAYEEILATFGNRPRESESTSLLAPAEKLAAYLSSNLAGEMISQFQASEYHESRRQAILAMFEGKTIEADPSQKLIQSADAAWAGMKPAGEEIARRVLLRMVRVAEAREQSGDTRLLVKLNEFGAASQSILRQMANTPLVTIERDPATGEDVAQISSDDLLRQWPVLQKSIAENRDFLLWRQKLDGNIAEWKKLDEAPSALLSGAQLDQAKVWKSNRSEELNQIETAYIDQSIHQDEEWMRKQIEERQRQATRQSELETQTQVALATSQQIEARSQRRGWLALVTVAVVGLAAGAWGYFQYLNRASLQTAANLTTAGIEEAANKNFDRAIEKYGEAIAASPTYEIAYANRGNVYFEKREFDKAIADFDKAIALQPDLAAAYVGRGTVYWKQFDYDRALENFNRAIELDPANAEAYHLRGVAHDGKQEWDKALADFNRAIELNPQLAGAFIGRGNINTERRKFDEAFADFNRAQEINPIQYEPYVNRCRAYLRRNAPGDIERAIPECNQALKLNGYSPDAYFHRGEAYARQGKRELAIADYQKSLDLARGSENEKEILGKAPKALMELQAPLRATENPPTPAKPRIYLHYVDAKDEATLAAVGKALAARPGFSVAGKASLVTQPTSGDIRYFYEEDRANAANVKQIVEQTLNDRRIELTLDLRSLKSLADRVPKGWIEAWLPSLPQPTGKLVRPSRPQPNVEQKPDSKRPRQSKSKY